MLAKKRSKRQRALLKRLLLLVLLALVLGGAVYLVYFSGVFDIEEVKVEGGELVPTFDGEAFKGSNILFFNLELNLDDYPKIATYEVQKDYLKRSLKITFGGRERFVIWCIGEEANDCFWVDQTGIVFSNAPDLKGPLVFRLVRDFSNRDLKIGDTVLEEKFFKNLKLAFQFLDETGITASEIKLENLRFREVTAQTSEGPSILFSLEEDPGFAKGVVNSLRSSGEWSVLNYLDLRIKDRAYYSQ